MSVASWPNSVAQFSPVQDFSGPNSVILAASMNQIFAEITAIEAGIGPSPFAGLPYSTLSQALTDLYINKSPTHHNHNHSDMIGDNAGDDHTQYMRVDGTRAATAPLTAPQATVNAQLATLGQVLAQNYVTTASAQQQIAAATANLVHGAASGNPVLAGSIPGSPQWAFYGGFASAATDGAGAFLIVWPGFPNATVGFSASCMMGGEVTVQMTSAALNDARVVFIDANGNPITFTTCSCSWMVLGC